MKKFWCTLSAFLLCICLFFSSCLPVVFEEVPDIRKEQTQNGNTAEDQKTSQDEETLSIVSDQEHVATVLYSIPWTTGDAYIEVNGNVPFFGENEKVTTVFETYTDKDAVGRPGVAYANICKALMPTESRGDISSVKPTGWVQHSYSIVNGGSLYNRSHLIAFQLAGENANALNLITGTRYMNEAMIPFENMVADYVKETDHHVLYRVTPVFTGGNLLADGVLMEALSVEDDEICFCVFCYNVQPGIYLDYTSGENHKNGEETPAETPAEETSSHTYVLNTSTKKVHLPTCHYAQTMSESSRLYYDGTPAEFAADEITYELYNPCGTCKPYQ